MNYDPERHHRRSIRLLGYNYRQCGAYYITICTLDRECLFGEIDSDGTMQLNDWGKIVKEEWDKTSQLRTNITLDAFVVMPNHIHGICVIDGTSLMDGGRNITSCRKGMARHAPTDETHRMFSNPLAASLPTIIGAFKAAVSRKINADRGTPGWTVWHRNYHEIIIRDAAMLNTARRYIMNNPLKWLEDTNHPQNT